VLALQVWWILFLAVLLEAITIVRAKQRSGFSRPHSVSSTGGIENERGSEKYEAAEQADAADEAGASDGASQLIRSVSVQRWPASMQ